MADEGWTELEGYYGHRIRYRWLDERRVEIEKDIHYQTPGEPFWEKIEAYNWLDGFRLGWKAAEMEHQRSQQETYGPMGP